MHDGREVSRLGCKENPRCQRRCHVLMREWPPRNNFTHVCAPPVLLAIFRLPLRLVQVKYVLLSQPRLPENLSDSFDFVILYDVLVHVDLHITNKYIREIARVLKPGGKAFLSTANFLSPGAFFFPVVGSPDFFQ